MAEKGNNWNEAVKRCSIFFNSKTVIAIVCEVKPCECGEDGIPKPLHYVVSQKIKNQYGKGKWEIVSTHALDSDKQEAWAKYGLPSQYAIAYGFFRPGEVVKPL